MDLPNLDQGTVRKGKSCIPWILSPMIHSGKEEYGQQNNTTVKSPKTLGEIDIITRRTQSGFRASKPGKTGMNIPRISILRIRFNQDSNIADSCPNEPKSLTLAGFIHWLRSLACYEIHFVQG